jgi:hypothetical protein
MQVLEAALAQAANPWPMRRERAAELAMRYPHAAEMLRLYQAYVDALKFPFPSLGGQGGSLNFDDIAAFAADRVLPSVVDATVSSGPARLRDGVIKIFCSADLQSLIRRWLSDEPLDPFETYLARASTSPLLEARYTASSAKQGGGMARTCPACGGLPQLSYFAVSGEALVTGPRYLVCSRCATNWVFSRMTCAGCGESDTRKLPIFQDHDRFPHIRIDGCRTCRRYLLTFDLRRDVKAVPIVDELAALPLDLYAKEQGLTKITPNLMGN